jgi:hypothetical protein
VLARVSAVRLGGQGEIDMRIVRGACVLLAAASLALTACGGGSSNTAQIRQAGQADQKLQAGTQGSGNSDGTVPVAQKKTPAIMKLGSAFQQFQDCLDSKGEGNADLSKAQTDFASLDPALQDALKACANKTGIVQLMKDVQKENDNLTPAEIKQRNIGFTAFRACALRNGWQWGDLKPDKNGLLSMTSGSPPVPPAGQKLSDLIKQCQGDAAKAAAKAAPKG